jgi:hypothetical protein
MYGLDFTTSKIKQLTTKHQVLLYDLWKDKSQSALKIEEILSNLNNPQNKFQFRKDIKHDKPVYIAANIETALKIKDIDINLRRIYKVKQTNRDRIIRQIISLLHTSCEFKVYRRDVKSFYESIPYSDIRCPNNQILTS